MGKFKEKFWQSYTVLILLTLFLKVFHVDLVFGITINISSIIIILVYLMFGRKKALIVSFVSSVIDIGFFHGYYVELLQVAEIWFIHHLDKRYKDMSIMVKDALFWLTSGIPALVIICGFIEGIAINKYYIFALAYLFTNSVFNTFISETAYIYYFNRKFCKERIELSFKTILIHILMLAIFIPFAAHMIVDIVKVDKNIVTALKTETKEVFANVSYVVNSWNTEEIKELTLINPVEMKKLQDNIEPYIESKDYNFTIKNSDGDTVLNIKNSEDIMQNESDYVKGKVYTEDFYKLVPKESESKFINAQWASGYFIFEKNIENTDLKFIIEIPVSNYDRRITIECVSQIVLLAFSIVFIWLIVGMFNMLIIKDLSNVYENSNDLDKVLNGDSELVWPKSNIYEIEKLTSNTKKMIEELKWNFVSIKKSEKRLYELAYYDNLTTLPNRLYFQKTIEELAQNGQRLAVLFLDLDRFKVINETLGYNIGDKLLKVVATRLMELKNEKRSVFRLGGDEFVVIFKLDSNDDVEQIGREVLSKFQDSFKLHKMVFDVDCSVGASVYPDHSENINTILQYADIAMYKAKSGNRQLQVFDKDLKDIVLNKLIIEREIVNALENNEFKLNYQPKYDNNTETVSSLEALIRWTNKELGVVPPNRFISIAEESNLILKIDEWVLVNACIENKRLQDEENVKVPISVNISAKHFSTREIEGLIKYALEVSGLEAKYLIIEITEGVLIRNFQVVEDVINNLNKMGISVSIDDFGTGYSSFKQLMRLPINEIKIDKLFVDDIQFDNKKRSVVKTITELAHGLDLNVVVEGIETEEERKCIGEIGCDELQGYLFSKPVTFEELRNTIKKRREESLNE